MLATAQITTMQTGPTELGRIFKEHHARIYKAAYRITGSASDAEDVLQTVFLKLARQEEGPDQDLPLDSYLYRAAINAALDLARARARQPLIVPAEAPRELVATDARPGDELELRTWLRRALTALSPRQAEMFVLRYIEGYDNGEIARLLGTSEAVVAVSLWRSRGRLQKEIKALAGGSR